MSVLLAFLLSIPGASGVRAQEPAPLSEETRRLQAQREALTRRLAEREAMLRDARALASSGDPRLARENREAARLLEKAIEETRSSLAALGTGLRKLREFGAMLAELRRKPKAVFGTSWVKGEVSLTTADGRRTLEAGDVFEGPGMISTGEGAANILLPDGTRLTLAPHTNFDTRNWTLFSGELYYEDMLKKTAYGLRSDLQKKFSVRTPTCVIAVRGTRFTLEHSSDTALTLYDGEVEVARATPAAGVPFPAGEPRPLSPGAASSTGEGERALLSSGGLSVELGPQSRLEAAKGGGALVFLRRGTARLRAAGEEAQALVPGGKARARDADWELAVSSCGAPSLRVRTGSVVLAADEKRLDEGALDAWWDAPYRE